MGIKCSSSNKGREKSAENIITVNKEKTKDEKNEEQEEKKNDEKNEETNNIKEKSPESNLSTNPSQNGIHKSKSSNELKTAHQKNVVSIDSNVFVVKGETSPDLYYIREKTLGHGSYGTVYLVKHKQLHRYFAMKVIRKSHKNKSEEENLMNEINILRKMDHPNILKMTDFYNQKKEYDIITEYCQEGELFNEIKTYAPFNETITGYYMKQILKAVCYCHGMNIVHRDLKPENILIVKRMKNGCHPIKIIDFGTAKIFSKEKKETLLIGSAYYIAPEVLDRNYTEKCDLWSCGVIMYILLTGRPPFGGNTDMEIMQRIKSGKFDLTKYPWGIISKEAKDLIKDLLQLNPGQRLSAEKALKHPWFSTKQVKQIESMNNLTKHNTLKLVENLTKYRSDNILRCAVIAYLVHNNTQLKEAHEAIKLFNRIDENGDGRITKEELYNGLQHYLNKKGDELKDEVELIFSHIDADHNGFIEYEEFIRAAIDKNYFLSDNFIKFAFSYFDRDGSGNITMEEVKNLFYLNEKNKKSSEAEKQLKLSFDEIDINHDGSLSFEEFVQMMKNIINSN